tara:strand:- start:352 stop:822 length:471 start_codon:yes stop_codon:yes gene_type:complete
MGWDDFSKKYKSRLDDNEPAGKVIAEEYHKAIIDGISLLGGKFLLGKVSILESTLTTSFNSMGAIPFPTALIQGITAYWTGGTYTYLPILGFLPTSTPIVAGVVPPLPLPIPSNLEFADALVSLVFIPHLLSVNAVATIPSVPPVLTPDIGFIVKK